VKSYFIGYGSKSLCHITSAHNSTVHTRKGRMSIFISPKHTADEFKGDWTIDNKIEVFIARVEGWQLGVAREMIEKNISNREVALLNLLMSYFEMISKYREGYVGKGKSKYYFKKGLREVFPDLEPEAEPFMDSLYSNVRCGLFHIGRTGSNVILNDSAPGSIGYNSEHGFIMISPSILVEDLQIHFNVYSKELLDPKAIEFRTNFELRFDVDNQWPRLASS
jgi:hypothetical protein